MRLDKYLAHAGLGTRKEVKLAIRKGRVCINGELCQKDDRKIQEGVDVVCVDGEEIYYEAVVYIMLNKPQDVVSATSDPIYETVLDCIDAFLPKDCFPVGRLDVDTEGLLLITNDGKLAHRLLSPKHHVEKTYLVELAQSLQEGDQKRLENGSIILDEEPVLPARVEILEDTKILLHIQEGRFHQVKRMLHAVGNEVVYLKRIAMGPLQLDEALACGEWRYLSEEEITSLKNVA